MEETYPEPTDIDISTMTVITKISAINQNKIVENSISGQTADSCDNKCANKCCQNNSQKEETFTENFEIDLDKF